MGMPLVLVVLLLLSICTNARPQDLETSMLLAAAQVKQLVESGAAAHNEQSVEILGQKMGGGMNFGFGDAMRPGAGRRRRSARLQPELALGPRQKLDKIYA
ncbi:uncharacterized protein LOC115767009 [Drosophila novamexicana]|uniref:uncharacterized protein LOC115767009 n=1 Tax=Drosophila novamexicana TaxID=47314 RepID=UPI0011E5FA10|nr:uncharacterized protein LOC115767009 [Drosophila novamexicana]